MQKSKREIVGTGFNKGKFKSGPKVEATKTPPALNYHLSLVVS